MFTWRVVRFSLACLPLAAFSGLGLVCQPTNTTVQSVVEQPEQPILEQEAGETDVTTTSNTNAASVANTNEEQIAADTAAEADAEEAAPTVDLEAQARDAERVARLTTIRDALEAYKNTNAAYPENVDTLLTSAYLSAIPKDIDESDFSYTPIGALPAQYYDLCYTLEVGVGAITTGYHCANPDGIANP